MSVEHVPERPTNVAPCATGPTTITVTWDAPWYAGSTPLSGYDVVATDSSGRTTSYSVDADRPSIHLTSLVQGETYSFMVAARNASGASAFSQSSAPLAMDFSAMEFAKEGVQKARGRFWTSMRRSMTKSQPTGLAAQSLRAEYREATQQPDDRYETLRSSLRDEGTTWVPPTGKD